MTPNSIKTSKDISRMRLVGGTAIAAWAVALAFGWWLNVRYEFAAANPREVPYAESWPTNSELTLASDRPTLLVFIHPKCPCTRATLAELDRLVTSYDEHIASRPAIQLVATIPSDADDAWWNTDLVAWGQEIAGCIVFIDRAGREAARFGVATSGTLVLFDENGERRFTGGATVSRGHEGASAGVDLLRKQLSSPAEKAAVMPVFGCRLCLPEDEPPVALQSGAPIRVTQANSI